MGTRYSTTAGEDQRAAVRSGGCGPARTDLLLGSFHEALDQPHRHRLRVRCSACGAKWSPARQVHRPEQQVVALRLVVNPNVVDKRLGLIPATIVAVGPESIVRERWRVALDDALDGDRVSVAQGRELGVIAVLEGGGAVKQQIISGEVGSARGDVIWSRRTSSIVCTAATARWSAV